MSLAETGVRAIQSEGIAGVKPQDGVPGASTMGEMLWKGSRKRPDLPASGPFTGLWLLLREVWSRGKRSLAWVEVSL